MMRTRDTVFLFVVYFGLAFATNFPSGFTNSSVNTAASTLRRFIETSYANRGWYLSETVFTWIQSITLNVWFIAEIAGSFMTPHVTDRLGRKAGYIIAISGMAIGTALQLIASVVAVHELLVLGRMVCGFMSPLSDASLILYLHVGWLSASVKSSLQECTPVSLRGSVSFLGEIFFLLMCVLGQVLGMPSVLGSSLTHLFLLSLSIILVSLLFVVAIPDTPKFLLITKNDREAAERALCFFQGPNCNKKQVLDKYLHEEDAHAVHRHSSVCEVLKTPHLRMAITLACSVFVLTTAFYPILQSSTFFLIKTGIEERTAELSSISLMVVCAVAAIVGSFFVDRTPRRVLILCFGTTCAVALALFSCCSALRLVSTSSTLSLVGCTLSMLVYVISYGMSIGPASWFVASELVSQRHRATVFSLCYAVDNVVVAVTSSVVLPLYTRMGTFSFAPLFVLPSIVSLVYLFLRLPETRGRETHEIVALLRARCSQSSSSPTSSSRTSSTSSVISRKSQRYRIPAL